MKVFVLLALVAFFWLWLPSWRETLRWSRSPVPRWLVSTVLVLAWPVRFAGYREHVTTAMRRSWRKNEPSPQ